VAAGSRPRSRPAGAGAGAGLGDRLVELLDALEDRGDVGDQEPVDRDVPEVRLQVQADVPSVAAHRPRRRGPGRVREPAGLPEGRGDGVGDPGGRARVAMRGDGQQVPGRDEVGLGGGLGREAALPQLGGRGGSASW
jgi:hypothetical protein